MSDLNTPPTDARSAANPAWSPVVAGVWNAVFDRADEPDGPDLAAADVARLYLALSNVHEAEQLFAAAQAQGWSPRDLVAAAAGLRAARKQALELVDALTNPRPPARPGPAPKIRAHRRGRSQLHETSTDLEY